MGGIRMEQSMASESAGLTCGASHCGVPCDKPATVFAYPGAGPWDGPSVEVPLCKDHAALDASEKDRVAWFIKTIASVVNNVPLDYKTEEEHKALERFADECSKRLLALLPEHWHPSDEESAPENAYWQRDTNTKQLRRFIAREVARSIVREREDQCSQTS